LKRHYTTKHTGLNIKDLLTDLFVRKEIFSKQFLKCLTNLRQLIQNTYFADRASQYIYLNINQLDAL